MTSKPETVLKKIKELENQVHAETFLEFYDWLTEDQDSSTGNASTYLKILRMFSVDLGIKKLSETSKEDIINFLDKRKKDRQIDPEQKWIRTWNDYLARLIGFYKWFANKNSEEPRENWDTPSPINKIKKKKNKRDSSYSPNDVWNIDELLMVVKYCDNIRDKAIFTIGWDMVSRNQEIVRVRVRDIVIKDKYAEISTSWDTKTGVRTCPVIIGFPYLKELLNAHPFVNDPNAFLILSRTTMKPLNPDSLWRIADTLKKRITRMIKDGEIKGGDKDTLIQLLKKPWNPYLMTRHSSITEKTDYLNDFQLKQLAGWGINSIRPRTYVHRKGKQIIDPLLQEHGIIPKKEHKITRKECPKCGHVNTAEATLCKQCSFVLDTRAWQETKLEEEQEKKELRLEILALKQEQQRMKEEYEKDKIESYRFILEQMRKDGILPK